MQHSPADYQASKKEQVREEIRGGNMDYQAINEAKDIL
jgi:hypothetical protein